MMVERQFGDGASAARSDINLPPLLVISIFGGIGLRVRSRELPLPNRKARALLAYLAFENNSSTRERVAGLLWSETNEQHARGSLRQVLSDIREALSAVDCHALIAGRTDIILAPDAVELDVAAMLRDINAGRVPELLLLRSRLAESAFTGYEDLSPLFQEWVQASRTQIHEQLLRALTENYSNPILPRRQRRQMAEAALNINPTHEEACRVVMQLAAEDGELGLALRAYANLYTVLSDELDMEPSAPTLALVAEIKQGHFDQARPRSAQAALSIGSAHVTLPNTGAPVVAILPFRPIGPDPVPAFFAEGFVDDTVRILANLHEPVVISSNSTLQFRGRDIDFREVGRRLGAQYLVSGTVRMAGSQLRLSVELADASTGIVLWSRAYGGSEPLFFEAQDNIAESVARTLVPRLRDAELWRSRAQRPEELAAYHLLLQARELTFRLERSAFERAGELLRLAIDRDPGYAAARAAAANWYSLRIGQRWSPDPEADTRALEAMARAAVAMDSSNGRALALLGHNLTILYRDYDEALALINRGLETSPNDAEAMIWSSPTYAYLGETAQAVRRAERGIALSPEDPFMFRYEHFLGIAHYAAGNYEEAAYWGNRSARANPHYTSNLRMTSAALVGLGRAKEARPLVEKILELEPGFRVSPMIARHAFRDKKLRETFGRQLVEAGLPA
jgi:DNA-binding SARP family transcriptional activator/Flp pilus assembly protein TadD